MGLCGESVSRSDCMVFKIDLSLLQLYVAANAVTQMMR